jgi:hypothetical protein
MDVVAVFQIPKYIGMKQREYSSHDEIKILHLGSEAALME